MDIDNPYYNYIISFTVPDIDNVTVVDYDALENRIYWSDVRTQTIKRAFINGTGVETVVSAGRKTTLSWHQIRVLFFQVCEFCTFTTISSKVQGKLNEEKMKSLKEIKYCFGIHWAHFRSRNLFI